MNKENKITINNLIYALLFLVLGIILMTKTEDLIQIVSKAIGLILIIVGIVKSIIYIYMKGKMGDYKLTELIVGIVVICCGTLFILYSQTFSFVIRLVIGIWILLAGINKIILSISMFFIDKLGFKIYLITSVIMIIIGILLISGLLDQIIGLLIILYSIAEIVDYIYYKIKDKDYESSNNNKKNKSIKKIKSKKVIDADIEE